MNLADWLKRSHPAGEQVAMVAALAQAVEEGHGQGVQYAGWSPARIQIRGDGGADLSALDAGTNPKEDLAYTAPEAVDGGHSTRSDVYSAGVILYEILSGNHPFSGLSVKQPRGAPKPLGDVRRDLPKDLADAVTACLERDPEWRPADLSYVLRVAQEAGAKPARSAGPAAPSGRASTGRIPVSGGRRDTSPLSTPRGGGGSSTRLPLILIAVVLVAGGAAGGYFFMMKGGSGGGAVTPPPTTVATAAPTAEPTPAVAEATTAPTTRVPATPLPPVTDRKPTAAATTVPTEAPAPTRVAVAATAMPTTTRVATAPPVVTAAPTSEPTQAPTAPPVEPASLKAVAPPKIKRGQQHLLDVRGANLRAELRPRFLHKGKDAGGDLQVARQRVVDGGLLQVLVIVTPNAQTGAYTLAMVDTDGGVTNAVPFEVTQ